MTMPEKVSGYKFSILNEDVASDDLFEDKTHKRIADNLFMVINQSEKSVTIGLEGVWGSGKSTVIKLLRDKLKQTNDKTLFFMFDAWAHDGDPLRRIFLESLIRELDPHDSNPDFQNFKKKIVGKSKTVTVTATKKASRFGKFISFFALLIPFGSTLLSKVDYGHLVSPFASGAGTPYWQFIFGLIFCLSPIFVLVYWIFNGDKIKGADAKLWKAFWKSIPSASIWETITFAKIRKSRSWDFFTVDSTEDYTQDITEDGERTSIEFEDYFKNILNFAMDNKIIDRCIIVVDNLDRIDPDHAKNIWSALQTFFQKRSASSLSQEWSDKVWFVIPFDREGFNKIWRSNAGDNDAGKSFLKKCFQLIAEVPQPVMSGWSKYAESCILSGLSEWPEHERELVLATYVRFASRLDESPTPRDIKVFCNQVGLLGAMWGGHISVEAMCLYILFKESLTTQQLRSKLVTGLLPNDYQTNLHRSVICAELAGLLFGVNKEKGIQLLLGPEIKAAFNKGDGKALASLLEDHGRAFWIAYESSRKEWAIAIDHTDEYKISATKAFGEGLISHRDHIRHDIQKLTDVWIESFEKLDFAKFDYSDAFNSLIDLSFEKDHYLSALSDYMKNKMLQIVGLVESENFSSNVLQNFQKITNLLAARNKGLPKSKYSHLNGNNWKLWLGYLEKSNTKFHFVLPANETIKSLVNESQLNAASPNNDTLKVLSKTFDIFPNSLDWEVAVDAIVNWMAIRNRGYSNEATYDLAVKLCLSGKHDSLTKFKQRLEDQLFWVSAQNELCNENPSLPVLVAITLKHKLQENAHVSPEVKSFWADDGDPEKLISLFDRLKASNNLGVIWELLFDGKNKAAAYIVKNIDDNSLFSCWQGVCDIDCYDLPDDEIKRIAIKLADNRAFSSFKEDMMNNQLTYQSVYKIFYSIQNVEITKFIDDEVIKVSTDLWKKCIEDNGDLIDLVKSKNPHFSTALNDYCISIVSGRSKLDGKSSFAKKLSGLFDNVTDLNKSFIPKLIRSYFDSEVDHLDDEVFNVLSPFFSRHLGKVEEVKLMERLCVWINSNQLVRINWLIDQDVGELKDPSENLIELVKLWINSKDVAHNTIATKLKVKFGLAVINNDAAEND
jgi:hypothetical protein